MMKPVVDEKKALFKTGHSTVAMTFADASVAYLLQINTHDSDNVMTTHLIYNTTHLRLAT